MSYIGNQLHLFLLSENIDNTISLDPLYRGLTTLLGLLLLRLASDGLITAPILF